MQSGGRVLRADKDKALESKGVRLRIALWSYMAAQSYNPSTWEAEAEDQKFKASLCYTKIN